MAHDDTPPQLPPALFLADDIGWTLSKSIDRDELIDRPNFFLGVADGLLPLGCVGKEGPYGGLSSDKGRLYPRVHRRQAWTDVSLGRGGLERPRLDP